MQNRARKFSWGLTFATLILLTITSSLVQNVGQAQLEDSTAYQSLRDANLPLDSRAITLTQSTDFEVNQIDETIDLLSGIPASGTCAESDGSIGFQDEERSGRLCPIEYVIDISETTQGFLIALDKLDLDDVIIVLSPGVPLVEATSLFLSRLEGDEITNQELLACFQCSVFETGPWYFGLINFSDTPQDYTVAASLTPRMLNGGESQPGTISGVAEGFGGQIGFSDFIVDISDEATSLRIELESVAGGDVDLYARFGTFVDVQAGGIVADYRSETTEPFEVIVIDENSDPPLEPGRYFMQVGNRDPARQNFTLTALITQPEAMQETSLLSADPTELSFSSLLDESPDAQALQFSNNGDSIARWNASSDVEWLFLDITSGNLLGESSVDLSAFVDTAGLLAGTHQGNITFTANGFDDLVIPVDLIIEDPNSQPETNAGQFLAIVFASLEFSDPAAWARDVVDGCVVYTNTSAASSEIQFALLDGSVEGYDINADTDVVVCGDVAHFETSS